MSCNSIIRKINYPDLPICIEVYKQKHDKSLNFKYKTFYIYSNDRIIYWSSARDPDYNENSAKNYSYTTYDKMYIEVYQGCKEKDELFKVIEF